MPRNEPQRSCISCRETKDKKDLLRFVLAPDRMLVPDLLGKLPGRGAYTCMKMSCLKAAAEKNQFARAFRGEVRSGNADEVIRQVIARMEERMGAYLALANKAGKVVSGADMVEEALKKQTIGAIFLAVDISPVIGQKYIDMATRNSIPYIRIFDKEQLAAVIGKGSRSVAAIVKGGFIETVKKELERYRNFFEGGTQVR